MAIKRLPSTGDMPRSTGVPESLVPGGAADSAGFPWEGRTFDHHGTAFAGDSGETPEAFTRVVQAVREAVTQLSEADTAAAQAAALADLARAHAVAIATCTEQRFLIPLVAEAGDVGVTPEGKIVEKSQELSIVTVQSPDGRAAMPVFSSVETMRAWNAQARPIPVPGAQVALAAAQEETDLVVIDPGASHTEYVIRRPALEAFALGHEVLPAWADAAVQRAFDESVAEEAAVSRVLLAPGDPAGRLGGPETVAGLMLLPGLDQEALTELTSRLNAAWAANEVIAQRVDSLGVQLRRADALA